MLFLEKLTLNTLTGVPWDPGHIQRDIFFFAKEIFVMDFNQFVRKFVIYETLKAELDYLNRLFYYSMKRVGVPGDPRAKNDNFSYLTKCQKIFRRILTIDYWWLCGKEQKSQKNQCSKINGFSDIAE